MFSSIRIGRLFGINVRVHSLWIVLVAFMATRPGMLLFVLPAFGVVLLHELGHSLVAQRFGIRVIDITLWPLGGMARMSTIPENTKVEAWIAIAGPAVNFLLAALTLPLIALGTMVGIGGLFTEICIWFIGINLMLGTFNLLPAFPMDGGRVLRAILGRDGDWVGATEKAVRVGRFFTLLMIFGGLLIPGLTLPMRLLLPIIGIWLWWVGTQELIAVRLRHARFPFPGFEAAFGQAPDAMRPVADARDVSDAATGSTAGAPASTNEVSAPGARRPREARRGWNSQSIEDLEGFNGPLSEFLKD